jgi:MFS family permease
LGLGGEWGGAILLATENAPAGKLAWYGSFPQQGAPLGFLLSSAAFLLISTHLSNAELLSFGWRVPFLASAVLVLVGLYVRLQLVETREFRESMAHGERVRVPFLAVVARHPRALLMATLGATTTFMIFYLMTVFALGWATGPLKFARVDFLLLQMLGVLFFAATIPLSALLADRIGGRAMLMIATLGIIAYGFAYTPLFAAHDTPHIVAFLVLGFSLTGLTYGPLGSALAELFPTPVRYTGISLAFNLAGVLGAAPAPYIAGRLAGQHGIGAVGLYLSGAGLVSLLALMGVGRAHRRIQPAGELP